MSVVLYVSLCLCVFVCVCVSSVYVCMCGFQQHVYIVYVCCICQHVDVLTHVCVWKPEVLSCCSPSYFEGQGVSLTLTIGIYHYHPYTHTFLMLVLQVFVTMPGFLHGCWVPSYTHKGTIHTELYPPDPSKHFYNSFNYKLANELIFQFPLNSTYN